MDGAFNSSSLPFFLVQNKRLSWQNDASQVLIRVINQLGFAQDFEDRGGQKCCGLLLPA